MYERFVKELDIGLIKNKCNPRSYIPWKFETQILHEHDIHA